MLRSRGQATIEFTILLSVSMLLFGVIFFNAQESLLSAATLREQSGLHYETAKVARAAKDMVYATDQRFVLLNRVAGLDQLRFEAKGQTLSFSNATDSWNYRLDQPVSSVSGSMVYPAFLLRVNNDQLVVDSWPFFAEPQSVVLSLQKGESRSLSMRLQNVSSQALSIQLEFPSFSGVTFSTIENPILLDPYHSKTITIQVVPESIVTGSFVGSLKIGANEGAGKTVSLPVQLSILDESPLLFYPHSIVITGLANASFSQDVTLCNASNVSLLDVSFAVSENIDPFLNAIGMISPLEPGCRIIPLTGTIPSDQNHSGFISVNATGASNALQVELQVENPS